MSGTHERETIQMVKGEEFRFEVDSTADATVVFQVQLKSGSAELYGVELAMDKLYSFRQTKGAIYTWYGCTLDVTPAGGTINHYTSEETPMDSIVNLHAQLEQRREQARRRTTTEEQQSGPRVLIAGPKDVGKSTLSALLLNYCLRLGGKPTFVDLDVGQGSITLPGTVSATPLDINSLTVEEDGFALTTPLVYFYGHDSPAENPELLQLYVDQLAKSVQQRVQADAEVHAAGLIINTNGWIEGMGLKLLHHAIDAFQVDVVVVIGQDRLYSNLKKHLGDRDTTEVVKIERSGGVVLRNAKVRRKHRMQRIREYFYGPLALPQPLSPCAYKVKFDDVIVLKILEMQVSDAMLPVGESVTSMERLQVARVSSIRAPELESRSVVSIVQLEDRHEVGREKDDWNDLLRCPSAGYLLIEHVHVDSDELSVVAPCPGPLPSKYLILGSIRWLD